MKILRAAAAAAMLLAAIPSANAATFDGAAFFQHIADFAN